MTWSDIDWRPTSRTLRQFAALWLLFFGLLAWRNALHGQAQATLCLGVLAGVVGVAGLVWPALLRLLFVGLTVLTLPMGWAVSRLVLALVFYGLFAPLGALFRLCGRDTLQLRLPDRSTYWEPKVLTDDPRRYLQMF